jgi:hypothetical protein
LAINSEDIVAATYGRSFWVLDHIAPLRQFDEKGTGAAVRLFRPPAAFRLHEMPTPLRGDRWTTGSNPPLGAIIDYFLPSQPDSALTLEILDSRGDLVRSYSSHEAGSTGPNVQSSQAEYLPTRTGFNRFAWDLHYTPPMTIPGTSYWRGSPTGPLAAPGTYQVRLKVGDTVDTVLLEVKPDPRITTPQADLDQQFQLSMVICDRESAAYRAVSQIRDLGMQVAGLRKRLRSAGPSQTELMAALDNLERKSTRVEEALIQTNAQDSEDFLRYPPRLSEKLASLGAAVDSSDAAPTQQSYAVFRELDSKLGEQLETWNAIMRNDIAIVNRLARQENVPIVSIIVDPRTAPER